MLIVIIPNAFVLISIIGSLLPLKVAEVKGNLLFMARCGV